MERSNSLTAEEVAVANIRHRRIRIPRGKLNEATFGKLIYAIFISRARISMVHDSQVSFRCSDVQILRELRLLQICGIDFYFAQPRQLMIQEVNTVRSENIKSIGENLIPPENSYDIWMQN